MKILYLLLAAVCLTARLASLDPAYLQNYCPVVLVNNSTIGSDQIYFFAHGNDPDGIPCFLVPDPTTGQCGYVYPTPSQTSPSSASSSVLLSSLPPATGAVVTTNAYLIYLPVNGSARAYLSVNNPMYLATALNPALGVMGINDPSVVTLNDPNFYTLYQDFEFGLDDSITNSQTNLFLNLSWVDYFCLPMQLGTYSYPSNTAITIFSHGLAEVAPAGTNPSLTRESIINSLNTQLTAISSAWGSLPLAYYNQPYSTSGTLTTYLRVLAAKNSIDFGANLSTTFQGAAFPQTYFPSTYCSNTSTGPVITPSPQSYMATLYNQYLSPNPPLYVQIYPAVAVGAPAPSVSTVYQISSVPGMSATQTLQFNSVLGTGSNYQLNLSDLSMEKLLSGATWPFTTGGTNNAAYTNELSKFMSALFTIGQLPYPCCTGAVPLCPNGTAPPCPTPVPAYCNAPPVCTTTGTYAYLNSNQGYAALPYFVNPFNYVNGPWYNVYDKLLHPFMIGQGDVPSNSTLGLGYAYDFDDLLNMSGLIAGITIQDLYGNASQTTGAVQPYIVVTLGSLSGTSVPDISQDTYQYDVILSSAPNGATVTFTYYDIGGVQHTLVASSPASIEDGTIPLNVVSVSPSQPFQVTFTFDDSSFYSYSSTFDINLQRQIVTPLLGASYTAADQQYQGSFTFVLNTAAPFSSSNPQFSISYDSSPPKWPG